MTVLRLAGGEPDENGGTSDEVSLDELLTAGVGGRGRRDAAFLDWVARVTGEGWQPTLRAVVLVVAMAGAVVGLGAAMTWFPAVCTTIALITTSTVARRARGPRLA